MRDDAPAEVLKRSFRWDGEAIPDPWSVIVIPVPIERRVSFLLDILEEDAEQISVDVKHASCRLVQFGETCFPDLYVPCTLATSDHVDATGSLFPEFPDTATLVVKARTARGNLFPRAERAHGSRTL